MSYIVRNISSERCLGAQVEQKHHRNDQRKNTTHSSLAVMAWVGLKKGQL